MRRKAASPTSSRMLNVFSRSRSDSGKTESLPGRKGASRAISSVLVKLKFILPSRPPGVRYQCRTGHKARSSAGQKEDWSSDFLRCPGAPQHRTAGKADAEGGVLARNLRARKRPRRERIDPYSVLPELGCEMARELEQACFGGPVMGRAHLSRLAIELGIRSHGGIHADDVYDARIAPILRRTGKGRFGGAYGLEGCADAAPVSHIEVLGLHPLEALRCHGDGVVDEDVEPFQICKKIANDAQIRHVENRAFASNAGAGKFLCERFDSRLVPAVQDELCPGFAKRECHFAAEVARGS